MNKALRSEKTIKIEIGHANTSEEMKEHHFSFLIVWLHEHPTPGDAIEVFYLRYISPLKVPLHFNYNRIRRKIGNMIV